MDKNKYNLNFRPKSYFIGDVIENILLPSEETEIEIAAVNLESVNSDTYSLKARLVGSDIFYKVEDDYDSEIEIDPHKSASPLTMGEVIRLIDSIDLFGTWGNGLTSSIRNYNLDAVDGENPEELVYFVSVTSEFYPQLNAYYEEEAIEWLEKVKSKI